MDFSWLLLLFCSVVLGYISAHTYRFANECAEESTIMVPRQCVCNYSLLAAKALNTGDGAVMLKDFGKFEKNRIPCKNIHT